MIPTGLGMFTQTTFGDQAATAQTLFFKLDLARGNRLTLETGEVFQSTAYPWEKRRKISASLNVDPASEGRDASHTNNMRYFEEEKGDDYEEPPFIHFQVSIPSSDYSLLLNNIREGLTPSVVTVELRHDLFDKGSPIGFDNAPDGSEMIWRNAHDRRVDVVGIGFEYRLIGNVLDDDEDAKPPTLKGSIDALVARLADLEKAFVKGNNWILTAIIIACAVLYFARH